MSAAAPPPAPGSLDVLKREDHRYYGWRPDRPDPRDHMFAAAPHLTAARLPPSVDLQAQCPPILDQGQLGSCTGNSIAAAIQFARMKQALPDAAALVPSRLFIYYGERLIEGTVNSDAGAEIRDGIKVVAQAGACFEDGADGWPYDISKFEVPPPANCNAAALKDQVQSYQSIAQNADLMKACLAAGYPFVFGFTVFPAFEGEDVARTGMVPLPGAGEDPVGGHAVMAMGYDDAKKAFKVQNSWGADWGLGGYFWIPYAYLTNPQLAQDFWTIRLVEA